MPVRILRLYIEQVLPHSRMTQVNNTDMVRTDPSIVNYSLGIHL